MTHSPEARYRAGMATFEKYGRAHMSAIAKGRKRRARFINKEEQAAGPSSPQPSRTQGDGE